MFSTVKRRARWWLIAAQSSTVTPSGVSMKTRIVRPLGDISKSTSSKPSPGNVVSRSSLIFNFQSTSRVKKKWAVDSPFLIILIAADSNRNRYGIPDSCLVISTGGMGQDWGQLPRDFFLLRNLFQGDPSGIGGWLELENSFIERTSLLPFCMRYKLRPQCQRAVDGGKPDR